MEIRLTNSFVKKLNVQVDYIAKDKPIAAKRFSDELIETLKQIELMPYSCRQSIYFSDKNIRDLIFKGYTIVYRIKPQKEIIEVFGLKKAQKRP